MPQSLARLYIHIVFATKNREPWLADIEIRRAMHSRLDRLCGRLGSPSLAVGGVADHVHILCALGRRRSVAELVKELKRVSSIWVKKQHSSLGAFRWQSGYGAFSIGPKQVPMVERYIRGQETRHRTESLDEEYSRLLGRYGIEVDDSVFE